VEARPAQQQQQQQVGDIWFACYSTSM
jgi:hypothetical protein